MTFNLSYKIKYLRKSKKITQTDLANAIGVTKSIVSAYETGIRQPSLESLVKIAQYFDVTMDYMFDLDSNQSIINRELIDITGLKANQKILIYDLIDSYKKVNKEDESKW